MSLTPTPRRSGNSDAAHRRPPRLAQLALLGCGESAATAAEVIRAYDSVYAAETVTAQPFSARCPRTTAARGEPPWSERRRLLRTDPGPAASRASLASEPGADDPMLDAPPAMVDVHISVDTASWAPPPGGGSVPSLPIAFLGQLGTTSRCVGARVRHCSPSPPRAPPGVGGRQSPWRARPRVAGAAGVGLGGPAADVVGDAAVPARPGPLSLPPLRPPCPRESPRVRGDTHGRRARGVPRPAAPLPRYRRATVTPPRRRHGSQFVATTDGVWRAAGCPQGPLDAMSNGSCAVVLAGTPQPLFEELFAACACCPGARPLFSPHTHTHAHTHPCWPRAAPRSSWAGMCPLPSSATGHCSTWRPLWWVSLPAARAAPPSAPHRHTSSPADCYRRVCSYETEFPSSCCTLMRRFEACSRTLPSPQWRSQGSAPPQAPQFRPRCECGGAPWAAAARSGAHTAGRSARSRPLSHARPRRGQRPAHAGARKAGVERLGGARAAGPEADR